jgi:hypothetical protein
VSDGSVVVCVMPADQIEAGTAIFAHLRSVLPASVKCLVHADNVNIYSLNEEQMRRSGWVAAPSVVNLKDDNFVSPMPLVNNLM